MGAVRAVGWAVDARDTKPGNSRVSPSRSFTLTENRVLNVKAGFHAFRVSAKEIHVQQGIFFCAGALNPLNCRVHLWIRGTSPWCKACSANSEIYLGMQFSSERS